MSTFGFAWFACCCCFCCCCCCCCCCYCCRRCCCRRCCCCCYCCCCAGAAVVDVDVVRLLVCLFTCEVKMNLPQDKHRHRRFHHRFRRHVFDAAPPVGAPRWHSCTLRCSHRAQSSSRAVLSCARWLRWTRSESRVLEWPASSWTAPALAFPRIAEACKTEFIAVKVVENFARNGRVCEPNDNVAAESTAQACHGLKGGVPHHAKFLHFAPSLPQRRHLLLRPHLVPHHILLLPIARPTNLIPI